MEFPDDPDLAFLVLEEILRTRLLKIANPARRDYYQYMNKLLCARDELQVKLLPEYGLPPPSSISEKDFLIFTGEVDRFRTRVFIRSSRRNKTYSVRFDALTK